MGLDRQTLGQLIARHGPVVRVVVTDAEGSTPREAGAAMCVWAGGQDGTIGGGALEHEAADAARRQLADGAADRLVRVPLGPNLGQCCGGAVALLSETWDAGRLAAAASDVVARPLPGRGAEMPLAVRRILAAARGEGRLPAARTVQGWFVEPVARPSRELWLWGAGHVGRAVVAVLAPMPDLRITWIDTAADRFPAPADDGVVRRVAASPADLVAQAPADAEHLVMTFSHALDLELCHRILRRGFRRLGLIGSATKWARFRSRLAALGHPASEIARIDCPIGRPDYGKHPQAIAIGVAAAFIEQAGQADSAPADKPNRREGGHAR